MTKATTRGASYKDPLYDQIEARWEKQYGLPSGGMRAIRTLGEKSNADQVSPVGARTVYQIMPSTRQLFLDKYKVDAYASPEAAAQVAALHLKESLARGNSWEGAVGEYHGGPDRAKWGKVNKAYRQRVTGKYSEEVRGTTITTVDARDIDPDELFHSTPDELFTGTRHGALKQHKPPKPSVSERVTSTLAGGSIAIAPVDSTEEITARREAVSAWRAEETFNNAQGSLDHLRAGFEETLGAKLINAVTDQHDEFDPEFMRQYRDNWQGIEAFAANDAEVQQLREATSASHLDFIKGQIEEQREREKIINSSLSPTALRIGTGILDPAGWAAGLGVGKAFQLAGVGGNTLIQSGRVAAGVASYAVEGAVGNVAVTAGLDSAGDYVAPGEYAMSALTGLAIGGIMGGVSAARGQAPGTSEVTEAIDRQRAHFDGLRAEVRAELGDAATPDAINAGVTERIVRDYRDTLDYALADVPAEHRLLVAEEILTESPQFKAEVEARGDLASVSDETERAMVAEAVARSQKLVDSIAIDKKALGSILERVGQESTAARLLKSESPVARAVGLTLLENAQGAGGRRRTAAIAMAQRERVYNQTFSGWDTLAARFRRQEGIGWGKDFLTGSARNQFNRRVMLEVERRGTRTYAPDASPHVVEAADLFENGMDAMRLEQQHVGTVGAARLGDSSIGYVPHRLDPRKVLSLTQTEVQRVREILAGQFRELEGFDAEFSDKLASKYLERAVDSAAGRYHVPFNLHSPEAGQIVRDALEALNLPADELEKVMGKFSRGGASHTKKRLKLDLSADIGEGKQLVDLFVTDVPTLYRSYARRVAGEVALAQYGVMGKKGLTVLSKAMTASGATPQEVKAFDQVSAEFLNTPFGDAGHAWMDNIRLATSASRLGGMGFTQVAEFGNAIPSIGVQGMLRGVGSMPRLMSEVRAMAKGKAVANPILKDLDTLGGDLGMEDYHLTRMFDVRDNDVELYNSESLGVVSRTLRNASHANMVLTGHRMILAVQTRGMAEQIVRKAVRYAKEGGVDTALDDMGIHSGLRSAIKADLDRIATFDAKGNLESLDLFKGKALKPHMVAELAQAVERGAGQIIQRTYTGETGAWAHSGFLKMLFQFRTFSLTSVEKQWGRNVRNYGALRSFMYLAGAMSFAAPIHLARVQAKAAAMPPAKRDKYLDDNTNPIALARATMNYASASGLAGDIMDVGAGFASTYGGDFGERFGDEYGVRGKGSQLIGGVVVPGAGLANDFYAGLVGGDEKKLVRSLPGSNLPYVSPFVGALLQD